jgi:hypothetical protein
MPNTDNEPQIPKNQSSITDSRTGLVSRDWYRFFLNLLNKANEGGNAGLGTVTSVSVSGGTTGLTTSGSPITTSGTITIAGTLDVDNGGTGATTSAAALSNLGAYPASNPNGYNSGTVTSVGATVPAFLSVSGSPVTTTGTLALTYSGTALPVANGGTGLITAPTDGQIDIGSTGVGFVRTTLTAGSGISVTNAAGSVTIANTSPSSGGTVTSVTGTAPVSVATGTTTPVISLAASYGDTQNPYASKTANYVLAAPNGAAGVPTFRAIVAADIPTLNQNTTGSAATLTTGRTISISGDLTYTSPSFDGSANVTAAGTLATVNATVGSFTNASLTVNGKGLVTAVSSGTAPVTSVTGTAPVVSSGGATPAISLAASYGDTQNPYASKTAKFVLAAPNAAAGVPTFRAIVASDIPTLNQNTTGTASNVTGTVAIANGGTGQTTAVAAFDALSPATTKGDLIVNNGTDNVRQAVGTDTYVLIADSTQTSGVKWGPVSVVYFTSSESTTAPNATVPVDALTVANASADVDVVLAAKGTGATLAQIPDSLTSGGNKRGTYATDWQKSRSSASYVASGIYSTVSGGADNRTSGDYGVAVGGSANATTGNYSISGGRSCTASGTYSIAMGYSNSTTTAGSGNVALGYNTSCDGSYGLTAGHNADARVRYSVFAISSEAIASTQPTQTTIQTVGKQTTTATPATLTALSSGTTYFYQNRMDINSAYAFKIMVVANVTGGGDTKAWELTGCIKRGASGAPTIVGAVTKTIIAADTGTSAWDVSVVIDTDAFSVQATGAAATTIRWAASIYCAEVEF